MHTVGEAEEILAHLGFLAGSPPDAKGFLGAMAGSRGHFAAIVEASWGLLACVDRIRSYPVFYSSEGTVLSNDARAVRDLARTREPDPDGVLEIAMAGYVTGGSTVFRGLQQLQAGEALVVTDQVHLERYDRYIPDPQTGRARREWLELLAETTDDVFARCARSVADRPVWVPLSGGFDSRLVLCKLQEHGVERLNTFSYGPRLNHEAEMARRIAEDLGVPWRFVVSRGGGHARDRFRSDARRDYWRFADGLCSVPSMLEYQWLMDVLGSDGLPEDVVIVNGQAGDFITGGHVPASLWEADHPHRNDLLAAIVEKHYALWTDLLGDHGNRSRIHTRILDLLPDVERDSDRERLTALYEAWEHQERQAKLVLGGQRLYDYLGLDWRLPLWDGAFVDLWVRVPYSLKFEQDLFLDYLRSYDRDGVFSRYPRATWHWPPWLSWAVPAARAVGLVAGADAKDDVYARLLYWGSSYANQYAMYGYRDYDRARRGARNPVSLFARTWLAENGLTPPQSST